MFAARQLASTALICLSGIAPAHAEFLGLMNGRLVGAAGLPDRSVEAGLVIGEIGEEQDYQYFGARFNYRASPELMLYGDIGQTEIEFSVDASGVGFGFGAFYIVEGIFSGSDFAVKGSYHTVEVEADEGEGEADLSGIVIEGVLSGREGFGANGNLGWYANAGMHRLSSDVDGDDDTDTEIGFGGGIVIPSDAGEFYVGLDIIDEMTFGGGFRYFLN